MTTLELSVAIGVFTLFLVGALSAVMGAQRAFADEEVVQQIRARGRRALERIVGVVGQAVTVDPTFLPLEPTSGVDSHILRFRKLESVDADGEPIFDPIRVYVAGPDADPWPIAGIIIARGEFMSDVVSAGAGADGTLGTSDDDTGALVIGDIPFVEILVPDTFTPSEGTMLEIDVNPAPVGRLLTFTLRLNARTRDGGFVLDEDVVLVEQVALRQ